jgi:YegS/Rv2252/BmrU family lipid kinase
MKRCVLIYNPVSGNGLAKKYVGKMGDVLIDYDYDPTFIESEYPGHISEIIKSIDETDLVISLGGDGTFYEVMNGNLEREKRLVLSHIPIGTTNDIGAMFGYRRDIIGNLKLLLEGTEKGIDICTINGKAFTYVLSFGKFMEVPYETPHELKHHLGRLAYILQMFKSLFSKTPKYDISFTVNGEKHRGKYSMMIISNANRIAGINNFYKDVKLNDSRFEIMLCSLTKIRDIARAFYYLKTSDISKVAGIEIYKTNNLNIKFHKQKEVVWCIDGEKLVGKNKEYNIEIIKDVKIKIPNVNIKDLFM